MEISHRHFLLETFHSSTTTTRYGFLSPLPSHLETAGKWSMRNGSDPPSLPWTYCSRKRQTGWLRTIMPRYKLGYSVLSPYFTCSSFVSCVDPLRCLTRTPYAKSKAKSWLLAKTQKVYHRGVCDAEDLQPSQCWPHVRTIWPGMERECSFPHSLEWISMMLRLYYFQLPSSYRTSLTSRFFSNTVASWRNPHALSTRCFGRSFARSTRINSVRGWARPAENLEAALQRLGDGIPGPDINGRMFHAPIQRLTPSHIHVCDKTTRTSRTRFLVKDTG